MPSALTYPGVYVEEISSGVRTITGVATSIAAFLGRTPRGTPNKAVTITSFPDFERNFGGLVADYPLSYAVRDFYLNGGKQALIVPLFKGDADAGAATLTVGGLELKASSPGVWGNNLFAAIDYDGITDKVAERFGLDKDQMFNLTVVEAVNGVPVSSEKFRNLAVDLTGKPAGARQVGRVLKGESNLVAVATSPTTTPTESAEYTAPTSTTGSGSTTSGSTTSGSTTSGSTTSGSTTSGSTTSGSTTTGGTTGGGTTTGGTTGGGSTTGSSTGGSTSTATPGTVKPPPPLVLSSGKKLAWTGAAAGSGKASGALTDPTDYLGDATHPKSGLHALDRVDLFNLLCIPPDSRDGDLPPGVLSAAMNYCAAHRAMLLVDPPVDWKDANDITSNDKLTDLGLTGEEARNAALYFPRVQLPDPAYGGQTDTFVPCGIIAGVMARTDVTRGVWKSPAGLDAALQGVLGLEVDMNDDENGLLNPLGINCLRSFPVYGRVVWGARTLRGADQLADEYKYVAVRRLALFLEESLYRGTKWVVFEPNDDPLWAQIRMNVGSFMHNLFRQGAFQGKSPRDAYFVKCDGETTTQNDIDLGIVNVHIGFAPLKPAEFVVLKIQQFSPALDV